MKMNFFLTAFLVLVVPVVLFLVWDHRRLAKKASQDAKHVRPFPAVPFKADPTGAGGADGGGGDAGCGDGGGCS
jgi:hypothetical protein